MQPRFSIVIPALNAGYSLEMVLRCLEAQEYSFDAFECIIVNDGSSDMTASLLDNYHAPYSMSVISNKNNQGRAISRNLGWRHAQGEFVAFLDADTLPDPYWLRDYNQAFSQDYDVISGTRYSVENNPTSKNFEKNLSQLCSSGLNDLLRKDINTQFANLHRRSSVGPYASALLERFEMELRSLCLQSPQSVLCGYSFITSNVAVRRNLLVSTNGFDPFLRRGEDTDLGIRIWELGARFGYAEGAAAYHQYDPEQPDRHFTYGEYLSFFYRNPYRLVILVYFWLQEHHILKGGVTPLASNLVQLVERGINTDEDDLVEEYRKRYKFIVPVDCQLSQDELVQCYTQTTGISESSLQAYLDKAVADGLYVRRIGGKTLFDFHTTSNWLRYRTVFQEQWVKATSYGRLQKARCASMHDRTVRATCEYRGSYEMRIAPQYDSINKVEALVNIPMPVNGSAQWDVDILRCWPPDLLTHLAASQGIIERYDVNPGTDEARVGYEFTCKVMEVLLPQQEESHKQDASYTSVSWPSMWRPKLKTILQRAGCLDEKTDYERVRSIYEWILDNTFYSSTPFPDSQILDLGCGSCAGQTGLFVNLCRLAAIPARERCGALLQRRIVSGDRQIFETLSLAASPFAHTWAECYIADRGWIPVEFIGQSYGRRILRSSNIKDQILRDELTRDTTFFDEYYFGAIDPYRIHTVPEISVKPFYPVVSKVKSRPTDRRLHTAVHHRLTCELVSNSG